jgi:predicted dinucleotide-binding enzyme
MKIGILGSGLMGGTLGTLFARAGHHVTFSYAHEERKLERLARQAGHGARDSSPADAGPLSVARVMEPFALLVAQLAYEGKGGPQVAYRFDRFRRARSK